MIFQKRTEFESKTSTVPNIWKSAKVVPIFESGSHDLPEDYRPISVLPVLSKVFEKAVIYQLFQFLETNKLLSDSQYGFRKYRSTKLAAALLCDNIRKEMNNGNMIGAVYLDLSKAFDTIGHGLLPNKLNTYGVRGKELDWLTDYLFNRTQSKSKMLDQALSLFTVESRRAQFWVLSFSLFSLTILLET